MSTRWSLAQACVWIATGDAARANDLARRCTIIEAGFTVFGGALTKSQSKALNAGTPNVDIDVETLEGIARRQLVWDAQETLVEALRNKQLIAIGRANGGGDIVQIRPELWLGLTLHDKVGVGVIAGPKDGLNLSATWFDEVSLAVDDVQRVWPPRTTRRPGKSERDRAFNEFVEQNPDATKVRAEEELGKLGLLRQEIRDRWKTLPAAYLRNRGRPKKE